MDLQMRHIVKSFNANAVLRQVDFSLAGGEVCALLGENGAGKSTLMNILGGILQADSGDILLDGQRKVFHSPIQSMNAGIAFIHQELNLVNDLSVYENLFLGRELKTPAGFLDRKSMRLRAKEIFDSMSVQIDPSVMVSTLDASFKQIVEIARALMMNASILIMDEPTTSLSSQEIERIFAIIRTLKSQGVGIVFISHKLREVMEICDRYSVLRDGVVVSTGEIRDTTMEQLAGYMVGHDVVEERAPGSISFGEELLRLDNMTQEPYFRRISLSVRRGEILGVTGLLGDGRSELFSTVFGAGGKYEGKIFWNGKETSIRSTSQAMELGIGYLPRNRKENAIIPDMTVLENMSVVSWKRLSRRGLIDRAAEKREFYVQREALSIKVEHPLQPIGSLSGGNQQKIVLAKWLNANPSLLILDNPTQGVDIGAKEDIYEIIFRLAQQGKAIVVLSNEAQEIVRLCHRAIVLYHGNQAAVLQGSTLTEQEIMRRATGV